MPTFERVVDGAVAERRHVPYRSRDLSALEKSQTWRKVAETYAPASGREPRPSVEEVRAARATAAKTKASKAAAETSAEGETGDSGKGS